MEKARARLHGGESSPDEEGAPPCLAPSPWIPFSLLSFPFLPLPLPFDLPLTHSAVWTSDVTLYCVKQTLPRAEGGAGCAVIQAQLALHPGWWLPRPRAPSVRRTVTVGLP